MAFVWSAVLLLWSGLTSLRSSIPVLPQASLQAIRGTIFNAFL